MSKYVTNDDGTYVDLEYTSFPAQCDSWENSEDLTASMIEPANKYRELMEKGDWTGAQSILTTYPRLKNMLINADMFNRMKHGIMALQRMFTDTVGPYIKSFTDAAKASADKAATSEGNAKASADRSKECLDNVAELEQTVSSNTQTAISSAKQATAALNYVQQNVGGFYRTYLLELLSDNWVSSMGSGFAYQNVVSCEEANSDRIPMASVIPSDISTAVNAEMAMTCDTGDATVTFYANKKPTSAIGVQLTLFSKTA